MGKEYNYVDIKKDWGMNEIVRELIWFDGHGYVTRMGEIRNACENLNLLIP
jgi:hypothetical protein